MLVIPDHSDVEPLGVAARVPWHRSNWPAVVTGSADQYCTCVTGAPAACRDGR